VSDAHAAKTFDQLDERYIQGERHLPPADQTPPSARIQAYVAALLDGYPDLTQVDADEPSPWAGGPLIGNASGPFIYFSMVTGDLAVEAYEYAITTANEMGLVAFDPHTETVVR
jgi:hypothetical protein